MNIINKPSALLVAMLGLFSLSSCNKSADALGDLTEARTGVTFTLTMPHKAPVTYAKQHDAFEYNIKNLQLFIFNVDGSLVTTEDVSGSVTPESGSDGDRYTLTKTLKTPKGVYRFAFVANEEIAALGGVATLSELQTRLAHQTQSAGTSSSALIYNNALPITGLTDNVAIDNHSNVEVSLTRVVARVDVINNTPDLKITEVKLNRTNSQSYLFPQANYAAPGTSQRVDNVGLYATLPNPFTYHGAGSADNTLQKAFYLYEGVQPSNTADVTNIEVTGLIGDTHTVHYVIPFIHQGKAVTVKRNHLYKVVLGDGNELGPDNKDITFDIVVSDWNQYTFNQEFSILDLTKTNGSGIFDANAGHLTLTADDAVSYFSVSHKTGATESYSAKVEDQGTDWLHVTVNGSNEVVVSVDANTGSTDRMGEVKIISTTDNDAVYLLKVKQNKR